MNSYCVLQETRKQSLWGTYKGISINADLEFYFLFQIENYLGITGF